MTHKYYTCGCCECYHRIDFAGDCRQDDERFAPDELDEKHGPFGWEEVEVDDGL